MVNTTASDFARTAPHHVRIWPRMAHRIAGWLDQPLVTAMVRRSAVEEVLTALHPLLSLSEVRARVVAIVHETADTKTFVLQPNTHWQGARSGQFIRFTLAINGKQVERVYSLSSCGGAKTQMAITVKRQEGGLVSRHLHSTVRVGYVLTISQAAGDFCLPAAPTSQWPTHILLLSAGSGITPVMAMLRSLHAQRYDGDVVFMHVCRSQGELIFATELAHLQAHMPKLRLITHFTHTHGRMDSADLLSLVPELSKRDTWMCGPGAWMDAVHAFWAQKGLTTALYSERFGSAPQLLAIECAAATVDCTTTGAAFTAQGADNLLVQAERAGMAPKHGCRMGICASCQCTKASGTVQNLVTGELSSAPNETIRLCISAARSNLTLAL
jgi:ferredoxin-NADP reductase